MYTIDKIRALAENIGRRLPDAKILLFGSNAKGTATVRSDIDLLIIHDTPLPFGARRGLVEPCLSGLLASVDAHVYTREEIEALRNVPHSFVASVFKTGVVVFDRGPVGD